MKSLAIMQPYFLPYIGYFQLIEERQETEGWGKAVVERLSADLCAEFGEKSGFSGRNLWFMRTFYREYKEQPILQPLAAEIAWTKNT